MPALLLWFALVCAAPCPAGRGQSVVLEDDLGHPFSLGSPPRRIVSLAPNITESLFALGLGPEIVGVTRFCDHPPEARKIEKVGGLVDPNLEKIQLLHPDLVIAFRGNPIGVVNKLRSLDFPVFVFDSGTTLAGVLKMIGKMGRLTSRTAAADSLCRSLEEERRRVEAALGDAANTPRVFLSLPWQGLWTCGSESYLNDLIVQARGTNIAGGIRRRWLNLTREQLLHDNPQVIIIMAKDLAEFGSSRDRLLADSRLETVEAVRTRNIQFLDENLATRFGPRLFRALADVARILHPERFPAEP
jgi:iron complex transport system substrate-binding protein